MVSHSTDTTPVSPRVSIGLPVYNGEDHVAEAIESVLSQTFRDFELIICDNASTDRTEGICRGFAARDRRIRYYRNAKNLGAAKNFNRTFELSRGEFFKWFAHDDVIAPTYLQRCVETLDQCGPNVVLCFPRRLLMSHDGHVLGPDAPARWFEAGPPFERISFLRLMHVNAFLYSILGFGLMRRDVLAKTRLIGGYKYSDLVLIAEMRMLGEFREVDEPLYHTRLHEPKNSTDEAAMLDPSNIGKKVWPELTLFHERLKSVRRLGGPWHKKAWHYACVMYGQFIVRSLDMACWQRRENGIAYLEVVGKSFCGVGTTNGVASFLIPCVGIAVRVAA